MEPPQKDAPEGEGGSLSHTVHELNNLLAVIQGYAEALSRALKEDDPARKPMEALMEALQRSNDVSRRLSAQVRGQTPEQEPSSGPRGSLWGTETVLLVDDEAALRSVTGRFLGMNGYKVMEAGNAGEALEAFERMGGAGLDVLVTDLMMPGISGADLARTLRQRKPGLRVLYLSGHGLQEMERQVGGQAGTGCLSKPFRPKELLVRLRDLLDPTPPSGKGAG